MSKKIKRFVYPTIYLSAILIVSICIIVVGRSMSKFLDQNQDKDYTTKEVFETDTPVMAQEIKIIKPYKDNSVKVGKTYYDYKADSSLQEKSIIYYENTYMPNSGIDYINDKAFEINSVLDGEVIDVKKDETLGYIIQIKHEKDLISVYQGLSKTNVKKGDKINQNLVIGESGTTKVNPEYKNYLHFEVYYKGEIINPEDFYKMNIKDL